MKDVTQVTKNYLLNASLKLLQVGIWELPSNWVEALSIYAKKFEFCHQIGWKLYQIMPRNLNFVRSIEND